MTDHLAFVRDYRLRDLVERIDQALDTLAACDLSPADSIDDEVVTLINQRGLVRIESAITEAAAFLHELRTNELTSRNQSRRQRKSKRRRQ